MLKRGRSEETAFTSSDGKKPASKDFVLAASLQNFFDNYPGDVKVTRSSLSPEEAKISEELYNDELQNNQQEVCLPVENMQGDVILGFNKAHNLNLIFDLRRTKQGAVDLVPEETSALKKRLALIAQNVTTLAEMINHRQEYRSLGSSGPSQSAVFWNISFGYQCLTTITKGTIYEHTMESFPSDSPFVIGATERSLSVGDHPQQETWDFGRDWNNDILISLASDDYNALIKTAKELESNILATNLESLNVNSSIVMKVNETFAYRGNKTNPNDAFYGHEHFGFLDGLSQPEVRGRYKVTDEKYDFIVRRRLLAEKDSDKTSTSSAGCPRTQSQISGDQRYKDYSRPGFRLLDIGHFLLGFGTKIIDTNDGPMQNPDPDKYRTLVDPCPKWTKYGSYVAYRKIEQEVGLFWQWFYGEAKKMLTVRAQPSFQTEYAKMKPQEQEELIKQVAGAIAAHAVGRWWDGTPVIFGPPISGQYYPPASPTQSEASEVHALAKREGLLNAFNFALPTPAWKINLQNQAVLTISGAQGGCLRGDFGGAICPFAGHIRKVNPRDEFTDIGSDKQTLKHRLIRRGNNYYENVAYDPNQLNFDRVKDVFHPTNQEQTIKRGLALLTYQADIEYQFEFLQHHWADSSTRPRAIGDDFVIGQKDEGTKTITLADAYFQRFVSTPYTITAPVKETTFTKAKGLGYFLLLTLSSMQEILTAPLIIQKETQKNDPPAFLTDFRNLKSYDLWDYVVDYNYWKGIWSFVGTDKGTPDEIGDMTYAGIGFRFERDQTVQQHLIDAYQKHLADKSPLPRDLPLQFYSTKDFMGMARAEQATPVPVTISWSGFPKRVLDLFHNSDVNPYAYVEILGWPSKDVTYRNYSSQPLARQMDEYCEWFTHRNKEGKITRIDISCESPEYWTFLIEQEPATALELYRQYVSPDVQFADLVIFDEKTGKSSYNLYNKWNTSEGIMHLNCPPNSLFAEVYIAAEASTRWGIPYPPCTQLSPDQHYKVATSGSDLILSGQYGLQTRNSDPTIGYNVNYYAREGLLMTVANPVGLYFEDLNTTGWAKPDGTLFSKEELSQMIHYERGSTQKDYPQLSMNYRSRIRVECPSSWSFVLGDCSIGGSPLHYAGKLIESSVTVFLVALGFKPQKGFDFNANLYGTTVPPKNDWKELNFLNDARYTEVKVDPPQKPSNDSDSSNLDDSEEDLMLVVK